LSGFYLSQLTAFLGLVPSEHSTGTHRRQGGITLTGSAHGRRMLVESALSYRFPVRQTKHLEGKARNASPGGQADRLEGPDTPVRALSHVARGGKNTKLECVAIARELAGFIWDIVRQEMPPLAGQEG
jgi:transposase